MNGTLQIGFSSLIKISKSGKSHPDSGASFDSVMPVPAVAVGLSLVGQALANISPNLVMCTSVAIQLFSWLQFARIPLAAVAASLSILLVIPMHYNVLYTVLTGTNFKDIDAYVSKGIKGFPNKKISWFDKIKVRFWSAGLLRDIHAPCTLLHGEARGEMAEGIYCTGQWSPAVMCTRMIHMT